MLEAIGRVGTSSRQRNYQLVAQYRANLGRNLMPSNTSQQQQSLKRNHSLKSLGMSSSDAIETASIRSKLQEGQRLSPIEMDHLSLKNPTLHQKAESVEESRANFENSLASCHTKQEARDTLMKALNRDANTAIKASATEISEDNDIIDEQAAEASTVQQMVTSLMTQIKASLGSSTKAGKTAEIAESAKAIKADVETASETSIPLPPLKDTSPGVNEQDILETFLFKIRALQNAWDKFIHTQDYKTMPEGLKEAGKQPPDSRVMDMIKRYSPYKIQTQMATASNVDIAQ
ncbi:hypothetical protein [Anaerovibrio lipolyticus]|jgi:uncharacterized protein YoaH (UPF0181 family)|uniref:hypothetical protein n=1 Tax=Anaerovibrio lipolyticus TaxID=82374 RepID=UPI0026EAB9D9|nr:hypothetical protein [Anaerovibrio lipolyticus]MBE6104771.1 hypothetical protein [Anaerovibrio lipolyticus]